MFLQQQIEFQQQADAKRAALPCLNSNNCIENANSGEIKQLPSQYENRKAGTLNEFSTSYKKSTTALEMNVKAFIEAFGLNKVGFLTLTFADDVTDPKEAQRRFHSLRTNFLKRHFPEYVCVYERTKKDSVFHGQIDLHFLTLQKYAPRIFRCVCFVLNGLNVLIYVLFSIN